MGRPHVPLHPPHGAAAGGVGLDSCRQAHLGATVWAGVWLHAGLGVLRLVGMCGLSGVCVCAAPRGRAGGAAPRGGKARRRTPSCRTRAFPAGGRQPLFRAAGFPAIWHGRAVSLVVRRDVAFSAATGLHCAVAACGRRRDIPAERSGAGPADGLSCHYHRCSYCCRYSPYSYHYIVIRVVLISITTSSSSLL